MGASRPRGAGGDRPWPTLPQSALAHAGRTAARAAAAGLLLFLVGGCIPGSDESAHAASQGLLSTFLLGVWHGALAPLTLLGEVVNRLAPRALPWTFRFYETRAASAPYDLGFFLGLASGPLVVVTRRPTRRAARASRDG